MRPLFLLSQFAKNRSVPHALLFSGYDRADVKNIAYQFAKYMLHEHDDSSDFESFTSAHSTCNGCSLVDRDIHPDFMRIAESAISIKKIRELKQKFYKSSFGSPYKVAIVEYGEELYREPANAFLKVLEEPQGNALFIVIAKSRSCILPTIASRCLEIKFSSLNNRDNADDLIRKDISTEAQDIIKIFSEGALHDKFRQVAGYNLKTKSDLIKIIDSWLLHLRYKLILGQTDCVHIKKLLEAKRILATTNASPQLLLENIFVNQI